MEGKFASAVAPVVQAPVAKLPVVSKQQSDTSMDFNQGQSSNLTKSTDEQKTTDPKQVSCNLKLPLNENLRNPKKLESMNFGNELPVI